MSQELTESQILAAQLLAIGKSCGDVADSVGVRRETISRWKKQSGFRAEVNTFVEDTREAIRNRLATMAEVALQVVENDLQQAENPVLRSRAAFKILALVGANSLTLPREPLPITAEKIGGWKF